MTIVLYIPNYICSKKQGQRRSNFIG